MPTFVEVYEDIWTDEKGLWTITRDLNERLSFLQKKGAKILDIKVGFGPQEQNMCRHYLILYEARQPIKYEPK